jgi:hypothetical protein
VTPDEVLAALAAMSRTDPDALLRDLLAHGRATRPAAEPAVAPAVAPAAPAAPVPAPTLPPGLHLGIPEDVYHADPCPEPSLSSSIAGAIVSRSPLHAYDAHPRFGRTPREETRAMAAGTLAHALLLGTAREFRVLDFDDYKTKAAKAARDEAREAGAIPVLAEVHAEAVASADAMRAALDGFGLALTGGQAEVTAVWSERASDGTAVHCRGRFDYYWPDTGIILDLKRSRSAHPTACQRHLVGYGYDIQRAAYVSALETLRPELGGRVRMIFAFLEPMPSGRVVCTPLEPSGSLCTLGARRWKRAVDLWAECLRTGEWPGYVRKVTAVDAPPWALSQDLDAAMVAASQPEPDWMTEELPNA